ncbi:hypothetical protein J6590_048178 [Homalodisca vitripennis]|nr:hypothetical protein J6590_048178 [Homalodisca vitripennis]
MERQQNCTLTRQHVKHYVAPVKPTRRTSPVQKCSTLHQSSTAGRKTGQTKDNFCSISLQVSKNKKLQGNTKDKNASQTNSATFKNTREYGVFRVQNNPPPLRLQLQNLKTMKLMKTFLRNI